MRTITEEEYGSMYEEIGRLRAAAHQLKAELGPRNFFPMPETQRSQIPVYLNEGLRQP